MFNTTLVVTICSSHNPDLHDILYYNRIVTDGKEIETVSEIPEDFYLAAAYASVDADSDEVYRITFHDKDFTKVWIYGGDTLEEVVYDDVMRQIADHKDGGVVYDAMTVKVADGDTEVDATDALVYVDVTEVPDHVATTLMSSEEGQSVFKQLTCGLIDLETVPVITTPTKLDENDYWVTVNYPGRGFMRIVMKGTDLLVDVNGEHTTVPDVPQSIVAKVAIMKIHETANIIPTMLR